MKQCPHEQHSATVARKNFLLTDGNLRTDPRLKVGRDLTAPVGLYEYLMVILLTIMIVLLAVHLIMIVLLLLLLIIIIIIIF